VHDPLVFEVLLDSFFHDCTAGKLGLVDFDDVEISNLHRQIIHSEKTVGKSKADSAKYFIKK